MSKRPAPEFAVPPRSLRDWPAWLRTTPGGSRLALRMFLGVTFCVAGLQKLANPAFFRASSPSGIEAQMKLAQSYSPISALLGPAVHAAATIGLVIAFAELAVGIGTLLGFRSRMAACVGMLLSLTFFLTVSWSTSPYYYGADIVFLFAWTPFVLDGAGAFSLDALLATRRRRRATSLAAGGTAEAVAPSRTTPRRAAAGPVSRAVDAWQGAGPEAKELARRTVLGRLGVTGVVSALVVSVGGIVAMIGRAAGASTPSGSSSGSLQSGAGMTGMAGSRTSTGGGTGAHSTPGASRSRTSRRIGTVSEVPVGQAAPFTFDGLPAYVVRPRADEFLGFSRICTHLGCTVNYVHSVQQFQCPCHGSVYSALTGQVLRGPAPRPLPKITVREGSDGDLFAS